MSLVNGEENYNKLLLWANDIYSAEEKVVFDKMIRSTDIEEQKYAINTLNVRYKSDNNEPNIIKGSGANNTVNGSNSYKSFDDYQKDTSNPLYKASASFRQETERKLEKAMNAGLI